MRPTVMRVSLSRLLANAKALRAHVDESVKMMFVVKADAYGHGAVPYSRALEANGLADGFAVAIMEEGRELREAGIQGMILVLGDGTADSLREGVRLRLSQAVDSAKALMVLEDEAIRLGVRAKAHLKCDTGMSRIGVRTDEELDALLNAWRGCPHVDMEGCFTHFCVADTDPDFTERQNRRFDDMLARVHAAGFAPIAHAAASSAMLKGEYAHDMVRAGIAQYGSCMPELGDQLEGAQTLVTRPARIERIAAGETVGYGRTFTAQRETVVMTLPIGYGDGYPRALSNRADVLVKGQRAPIIGRVCMDMLMADVTDIAGVTLTDEVVLLGGQGADRITADELAALCDTIPYEIMLGFLPRILRVIEE